MKFNDVIVVFGVFDICRMLLCDCSKNVLIDCYLFWLINVKWI